ncbi:MAG: hypothetical protein JO186_08745 [Actinobacteria bacterium]|nr:hypothetical protein [Actinomycetota bacterium]MBV8396497.1 hypothetical protein [Actinomycetota bacterium]MBV8598181.1 hypothetical protein [Actinomycetota bacterium]
MPSRRANAVALAGYAAISYLFFGLPLGLHPGRDLVGTGRDPQLFVWDLAWWPHAILHGENPFVSHAIYAPSGINLAWVTSVPGIAILFAPVTLLFGPDVSFNVAEIAMPALAAWTAYLLCRHLTGRLWPSLVGGYLFGFSSYMLGAELGHLHLTAVFLLPLIALAVVRRRWRVVGLLFGLQLWFATEVAASAAIVLGLGLVVARHRVRLRSLAEAVVVAVVVASPLLWYVLTDFRRGSVYITPDSTDGDLLNLLLPTRIVAAGGPSLASTSERFFGDLANQGLYLGLPTLVIVAWFAARRALFAASFAVLLLLTLGTALYVDGHHVVTLPWKWLAGAPILDNVLPARFSVYLALLAAVMVALWMSSRRAYVLPALAVASLVPAVWNGAWHMRPERWGFFTSGEYRHCILRNENVAIFPFGAWGSSTLWQAESDFWFRMPGGYLVPRPPAASLADPTIRYITFTGGDPTIPQIVEMVKRERVDRVVSVEIYAHPNGTQMHRFGALSVYDGIYIAPTCGYPSLRRGIHPTPPHPATVKR